MPEYALWTLVISLIMLSLGLCFRIAELSHLLKLTNKEINSSIEQARALNKRYNEEISNRSELNDAVMNKILEKHNRELHILFAKIIELQEPKGLLTQLINTRKT